MNFSKEAQHSRIQNITYAEQNVSEYAKKVRIRNYIPGQVTYSLGDYPEPISTMPTEYDYNLIKSLAERGAGLIQIHEEWNDGMLYHGADKYSSTDPEGLQQFVNLCHDNGVKIIPYISSGYVQAADPSYREEFSHTQYAYKGVILDYRKGSADSAAWRNFIIPKTLQIIDQYGFDGVYNDWGYDGLNTQFYKCREAGKTFNRHDMDYDPYIEDLLCIFYEEIHKRNGIYKLHDDNTMGVYKEKLYDYLWIGEGEPDPRSILSHMNAPMYIVPCPDKKCIPKDNPRFYFALTIPFVQFPLLTHGRPLSGMRMHQPNVFYDTSYTNQYKKFMEVSDYCLAHPNGPYVYSRWSSIPDDPEEINYWCDFLDLYKPMVTEGSIVHMNIRKSSLFLSELSENTIASLFTNEEQYLVISNIGDTSTVVDLAEEWFDRETKQFVKQVSLAGKDICFLQKKTGWIN